MEKDSRYFEEIKKIVDLQNEIEELERWAISKEDEKYIQASCELIRDIYLVLEDLGHTKEEIDRDVAYC